MRRVMVFVLLLVCAATYGQPSGVAPTSEWVDVKSVVWIEAFTGNMFASFEAAAQRAFIVGMAQAIHYINEYERGGDVEFNMWTDEDVDWFREWVAEYISKSPGRGDVPLFLLFLKGYQVWEIEKVW